MLKFAALTMFLATPQEFTPAQAPISADVQELIAARSSMTPEEWVARFDALGEAGDYSAWQLLGELYSQGDGDIARNMPLACEYFERTGANRGDALHSLASCYFQGQGRAQDYVLARDLYRQAIASGHVTSLCGLGTMLVRGQGGEVAAEEGVALCRQATELGDKNAKTDLGIFLLTGEGVERDPIQARLWLEEAGGEGQANAAFLLGQIYARGDSVTANADQSEEWFATAYENGRGDAAWRVATSLAARGLSTDGDEMSINPALMSESQAWAEVAATMDPDPQVRAEAAEFARSVAALIASVED